MGKQVLRIERTHRNSASVCSLQRCQSLARSGNASRFFDGCHQTNRQNPAKRITPKREWTWRHFQKGVMDEEGKKQKDHSCF